MRGPLRYLVPSTLLKRDMFSSLQHRNYRLYWIGTLVSNIGEWMDNVAFNWLMWDLTGSGAFLGGGGLVACGPFHAACLSFRTFRATSLL